MKKHLLTFLILASAPLLNAENYDEKLFLEPHLSSLAGKVAFQGGSELAQDQKSSYEYALSVNCGIHLPPTTQIISKKQMKVVGLGAHLSDIADSLKDNATAVITAPASYDIVFTTGKRSNEEIQKDIAATLEKIGNSQDSALIISSLNELKDVSRATFVKRDGKLKLVTNVKELTLGEKVWRKNPEGAQLEIFHSEEEYLVAIRQAGLICEEIKRPCFFGEVKWKNYNATAQEGAVLGASYKESNPFTIYLVRKA